MATKQPYWIVQYRNGMVYDHLGRVSTSKDQAKQYTSQADAKATAAALNEGKPKDDPYWASVESVR